MLLQLHQIYSIDATINSGNCIKDEKTKIPRIMWQQSDTDNDITKYRWYRMPEQRKKNPKWLWLKNEPKQPRERFSIDMDYYLME